MKQERASLLAALIIVFSTGLGMQSSLNGNTFSWDVFGYYIYLPATFIHADVGLEKSEWLDAVFEQHQPSSTRYQIHRVEATGRWVTQYTSGMAVLYAPFFLGAHVQAHLTDQPADGFSQPYQLWVNYGMLLVFALGLGALVVVLTRYWSDYLVAIGLLVLYFGTNLMQVSTELILSPHIALFGLYALLIWASDGFHRTPTHQKAILIGLFMGLIVLNRPTEIVAVFIPLFWGIHKRGISSQKAFFVKHKLHLLGAVAFAIAVGSIQFFYWKYTADAWIYHSYRNPGEGLDLLTPHLFNFLLSFRKGWLIYTPLGLFMLYGLVQLKKHKPDLFWPVLPVVVLGIYLMSSWTTWWYAGGSFSARTLVNMYPVLFIPLLASMDQLRKMQRHWMWLGSSAILLCVAYSTFKTWQWKAGIISNSRMTAGYYFKSFFATQKQSEWERDLLVYRSPEAVQDLEHPEWYAESASHYYRFDSAAISLNGKQVEVLQMDSTLRFSQGFRMAFEELTDRDHVWLILDAQVFLPDTFNAEPPLLTMHFDHNGGAYKYRTHIPENWREYRGQWMPYHYEYLTPEVRSASDEAVVYFWYRADEPVYVKELSVRVLERTD